MVASPAVSVHDMFELQDCRLVGLAVLPNATCTHPTPASVAQVVVKFTDVELVYAAPALMLKLHQVGVVLSIVK